MTFKVFNIPNEDAARSGCIEQLINGALRKMFCIEELSEEEAAKISKLLDSVVTYGKYSAEDFANVHSLSELDDWSLRELTSIKQAENKAIPRSHITDLLKQLTEAISQVQASRRARAGEMPKVNEVPDSEKMTKAKITSEYGFSNGLIAMLRAKRFLPDPYAERGNVIYWLRADITPYLEAIKTRSK